MSAKRVGILSKLIVTSEYGGRTRIEVMSVKDAVVSIATSKLQPWIVSHGSGLVHELVHSSLLVASQPWRPRHMLDGYSNPCSKPNSTYPSPPRSPLGTFYLNPFVLLFQFVHLPRSMTESPPMVRMAVMDSSSDLEFSTNIELHNLLVRINVM